MGDLDFENKPVGEATHGLHNGLSNGTSNHHEHKHRSKDKDHEKDKHKEKHKSSHKDKEKHKDRHSSSHKSSHKDKDKDRERSKDKEKDRHKDKSEKDKDKERSRSDKDKSKSRDDKHRSKEKSEKDRHDRDKGDKYKDKDKSKEKDRHRDDKERKSSSSSSSKKDRHHSSHKSSHKDKHRERDREEEIKIKEEKQEEEINIKTEPLDIKMEPEEVEVKLEQENDYSMDYIQKQQESDDDAGLVIKEEKIEEFNPEEEDDIPLAARKKIKIEMEDDDDDDKPLIARKKVKVEKKRKKMEEDDDEDFKPVKKRMKEEKVKNKVKKEKDRKSVETPASSPTKGRKKKEEEENVWKWWEEEKRDDGVKWTFLEHKGPVFADPYEPLPSNVKFYYNGEPMVLSEGAEEVAGFYAKMLEHDYTSKEVFNTNFFKDWRKVMTPKEKEKISDFSKCDFNRIHVYYVQKNEERKNRTKEEKKALREKNEAIVAEYGWCTIDGHKQRIGNFKIEPPGLFRGRGEHPKQGMLKKRTMPEDVIINCSKDSQIPSPPSGRRWKEVRHDNAVTWLACWNENIQGSTKYVMLNAASKLKGEKDWQKYETARRLHKHIDNIREKYRLDWKSKEMRVRQRGVALYFIDKLALRAGNEKDEDQADTVGCCSLRFEHLTLHEEKDGKEYVVVFDFLGKDSIRYYNEVSVEKRVFKNLQLFMENKQEGDDIFDRLNTQILNKHLNELLEGLTAKVFRTYNASRTLQEQLEKMTNPDDPIPAQILSYNRANREVAILCNHQRAVPKTFDKSMANLQKKIDDKKEVIKDSERELKDLKKAAKHGGAVKEKVAYEKKKKAVDKLKEQLHKLEISATDKEENKQIALGTSKLNYLDPRITVAWCKKNNIPIDKVYNKTQRLKFQWAIDMATAEYNFMNYDTNAKFSNSKNYDEEEEYDEE